MFGVFTVNSKLLYNCTYVIKKSKTIVNSAVSKTSIIPSKSNIKPHMENTIIVRIKKKNLFRNVANNMNTEMTNIKTNK